jgi:hypothetical protein
MSRTRRFTTSERAPATQPSTSTRAHADRGGRSPCCNPFFTTKPAGEGTWLGLSLSHDIVVKQHGGTQEVSTEPGSFTQFTIVLPRAARGAPAKAGASA